MLRRVGVGLAFVLPVALVGLAVWARSASVAPLPGIALAAPCQYRGALPDPSPGCTPGAVDPRVTPANIHATICVRGYTATVRPAVEVTALIKAERLGAYGLPESAMALVELDHLVPLELGGAPAAITNLWVQPWDGPLGARVKDQVEDASRQAVCAGRMGLGDAQQQMRQDWVALGRRLGMLAAVPSPLATSGGP